MSKGVIVVTGGTGILGSHLILQLLQDGYTVRCPVRPNKIQNIRSTYPKAGSALEVYEITDMATGDYSKILKGAAGLIHSAAPNSRDDLTGEQILSATVDGTVNVVKQAVELGVTKIIATSSLAALVNADFARALSTEPLTENSWNSVTRDEIDVDTIPGFLAYFNGKAIAEREFWEIADQNPQVDFTTIVAPGFYGRLVPNYPRPGKAHHLSSISLFYDLITLGPDTWPSVPVTSAIHIDDCVRAHILALTAGPLPDGKHKRLLISCGNFTWRQAADLIRQERPELASRLPRKDATQPPQQIAPMDRSLADKILGVHSLIPWQKAALDSVDTVVAWEKSAPGT